MQNGAPSHVGPYFGFVTEFTVSFNIACAAGLLVCFNPNHSPLQRITHFKTPFIVLKINKEFPK
jgi:hypothetical protein